MAWQLPAYSDFQALFPELAVVTQDKFTFFLTMSTPMFNRDRWDDLLLPGTLYWIAHTYVLSIANATQQTTDDVIMKKIRDVQKQRDGMLMNKEADNPYYRTTYGQQYLYYLDLVGMGGIAV